MIEPYDHISTRRYIHDEAHKNHASCVAGVAHELNDTVVRLVGDRDAAIKTIAILRGGDAPIDLESVLAEIRTHTGGFPSGLGDLATALAFRLYATRAAGVINIDATDGLVNAETELRDVANRLVRDIDDLRDGYVRTVIAVQRQHISQPDPEDGVTCHPDCPACVVIATVPIGILAAASAALNQSGATQ